MSSVPTSDAGTVALSEHGATLLITIDRPQRRNAITQEIADGIDAALSRLEGEDALRVAVLTGAPPCFSAGTDLALDTSPQTVAGGKYGLARRRRSKPLVAAVEGYALGGGTELVLACDLVVAARDAVFGLPEVLRGVVANCGALFRAPDRLPPNIAAEMLLTGEPIEATRAFGFGLVNRLCEPGEAVTVALALAERIALASPAAVGATMHALADHRAETEDAGWRLTERADHAIATAPDRAEGIAAFFERRAPRWAAPQSSR